MTEKERRELSPQEYIRKMFEETKDGKFVVECRDENDIFDKPQEVVFELKWTKEDAEKIVGQYNLLTEALARIAPLHERLNNEENRKTILSNEDLQIWETYVKDYEPFDVDFEVVEEIRMRAIGDLLKEEKEILDRFYKWREEQSQKRIPFNRRSNANMITRAIRFERLLSWDAPQIVVMEEGRCLAEEMVLYYVGKEQPIILE